MEGGRSRKGGARWAWRHRVLAAASVALLLAVGGCGLLQEVDRMVFGEPGPSYEEAYKDWTRRAELHRDLGLVLDARATFRSEAFQEAYLRRWAKVYKVKEAELARQLAEERKHEGRDLRFVLVASTGRRDWNDFAKTDSIWHIFLQNERGERLAPTDKRHLDNRTEVEGFFPMGPWGEAYELTFELAGEQARSFCTGRLTLVVASVLGQTELSWDVEAAGP